MNQSPSHNFGTPADNWASGHSKPKKDSSVWIMGMLVGAVIFAVGCGSGLLIGWFAGMANSFSDMLSDMDFDAKVIVEAAAPDVVIAAEPFSVTVTVTDTSGIDRILHEIDFMGTLADNAQFANIHPAPTSIVPYPGYKEFYFEEPLQANQSAQFSFEITPTQAGIYIADITIYMEDFNSESTEISVTVAPN